MTAPAKVWKPVAHKIRRKQECERVFDGEAWLDEKLYFERTGPGKGVLGGVDPVRARLPKCGGVLWIEHVRTGAHGSRYECDGPCGLRQAKP